MSHHHEEPHDLDCQLQSKIERQVAGFRAALDKMHADPAETERIDALINDMDAEDDMTALGLPSRDHAWRQELVVPENTLEIKAVGNSLPDDGELPEGRRARFDRAERSLHNRSMSEYTVSMDEAAEPSEITMFGANARVSIYISSEEDDLRLPRITMHGSDSRADFYIGPDAVQPHQPHPEQTTRDDDIHPAPGPRRSTPRKLLPEGVVTPLLVGFLAALGAFITWLQGGLNEPIAVVFSTAPTAYVLLRAFALLHATWRSSDSKASRSALSAMHLLLDRKPPDYAEEGVSIVGKPSNLLTETARTSDVERK
ncbi:MULTISPECIES: hypothetical protein [unclassified Nonomuraea]|uniref:hypothetical protein n=1 Tax=unclassified Nonomuraea TaxID=2593643 RepID=UPI0033C58E5B